jgi:4-amino-4-deoxy-L-arabinose transferase-like glycosyltransferase
MATPDDYFKALGGAAINPKQFSTHDYVVHHLGHAMFPWSAVLPLALGLTLRSSDQQSRPELALRTALFLISVLGVGCYTLLAPRVGLVPYGPVFALAGIVALALRELDRRSAGIVPLAMVTAALLVLFYTDYKNFPEKGFSAFGVAGATFPESFQQEAKRYSQVVVGLGALACVLLVLEQAVSLSRVCFTPLALSEACSSPNARSRCPAFISRKLTPCRT